VGPPLFSSGPQPYVEEVQGTPKGKTEGKTLLKTIPEEIFFFFLIFKQLGV